ncbi:MmcQ/YjbR family DNA-binding protein [Parapedobacter sp. ISTM3]|uniref:Predicted DNA-binding protein, MmcQ/YjbR family n=1 Tax=Parapedobacter luteus TaxID=623280 RepID=A0A1T5BRA5_9SPHI|nr:MULTISPECIES: MmcQ/YjbR family DNA-binding protein [Parapedobacter]MBK1439716.1 MmcQ/YjbR family DNA-binding protein [Parapedobacter sp. ISTM3]SKB49641.1 Predicted DNA-binding protein, MmcQ/YjbR family [Parapedobacter luteus]
MHIEQLRDYCLSKPGVTESCPFGPEILVFKVAGKMFLLTPLDSQPLSFSAKCDPEYAVELRERHPNTIKGAYHMNKRHWNEVVCNGELSDGVLENLISHSYELVVAGLRKQDREALKRA